METAQVPDPTYPTLGSRIYEARKAKFMTQEQLADKAGIHKTYISKIEKDQHVPTITVLQKIAFELGVDLNTLVDGTNTTCTMTPDMMASMWSDMSVSVADAAPVAQFLTTESGYILQSNEEFRRITGYEHHEEELPFVNATQWLPTNAIPKQGRLAARISGRNGRRLSARIAFRKFSHEAFKHLIIATIIPN